MRSQHTTLQNATQSIIETLEARQLMAATLSLTNPDLLPASDRLIFNTIQSPNTTYPNVVHNEQVLAISDSGTTPLTISSMTLSGPWAFVGAPSGGYSNVTVNPGTPLDVTLKFTQTTLPAHSVNETNETSNPAGGAAILGSLLISSNDATTPNKTVTLAGYWQSASEDNAEPNLTTLVNTLAGYSTVISNPYSIDLTESATTPTYYGQEIYSPSWSQADTTQPVTIQYLAAYHTEGNAVNTFWYANATATSHLLMTTDRLQGQTILPTLTDSNGAQTGSLASASFNPAGAAFGFRIDDEYSDDAINNAMNNTNGGGHHVRFYPLVDENGATVPNTYIMAMDYAVIQDENFDFNDNVYIVSNITPNNQLATPGSLTATNEPAPVLSWSGVSSTSTATLAGYNVYRATSPSGPYTKLTSSPITATSYTDSATTANGTYYYQVTSVSTGTAPNESAPATATVTINTNTSGKPIATSFSVAATTAVPIQINVLNYAIPESGSTLIASSVTLTNTPTHGTASVNSTTGLITYTSNAAYTGSETLHYTVEDTDHETSTAGTITITVSAPATGVTSPHADDDSAEVLANSSVTVNVLANDVAVTTLVPSSVALVNQPSKGTATVNSNGTITYVPGSNYVGADSFTYTVLDADGQISNAATVSINVGVEIEALRGAPRAVYYTDTSGTAGVVTLNRGTANVFFSGTGTTAAADRKGRIFITGAMQISDIVVSGTNAATTLAITSARTGLLHLGGITSPSATIGAISAPTSELVGTLSIGGVRALALKSADIGNVYLGSTGVTRSSVSFASEVIDSSLTSGVPLSLLRAPGWVNQIIGSNFITAPSISSLAITGEFDPSLTLTGGGVALAAARITGVVNTGFWAITGNARSISLGSVASGTWGGLNVTGVLSALAVRTGGLSADVAAGSITSLALLGGGSLTGNITAGSARAIRVTGGIAGSALAFSSTGVSLNALAVTGAITASTITTAGNLGAVSASQLLESTIDVGTTSGTTFSNVFDGNIGTATLNALRLNQHLAGAFADSVIIAHTITSAALGNVTVANGGVPQGLALETLHAITLNQNGQASRFSAGAASQTFSDFEIKVVSVS